MGVIHSPFKCSSHCCYPGISECKYESNTLPLLNAVLTAVILVSRNVNMGVIHSPFECSSHCCYPGISECKYGSNTLPF